ncbi:DNA/RNA non-specific endonuclease [Aliikangiella sp. G2MR2-5]|uniref:DNA/RNA non-specific endonuclease n=1 Tax=Aliikangiella sp. G2MR2-5 TaxID=2788943 RepID=UPI0018A9C9E5|nr:DNA/RNA non-specific endonuclease [Aliikangiella sp. G2MR2-5]
MRNLNYVDATLHGIHVPHMASAIISSADIGTGTPANPAIHPPGWGGGAHPHHHHRGHLIARQFGGDGNDQRNLVTLTDGTNLSLHADIEGVMRDIVEANAGNEVLYEVIAYYDADEYANGAGYAYLNFPMPSSFQVYIRNIHDNAILYEHRFPNGVLANHNAVCC